MELDVLMNGELAGTLSYTAATHRYAFRYSPTWLSRKERYALGPTLPLEAGEAAADERHSAVVRQFFDNLLPEGQALDDAASTHKVSKGNLLGLLAALGGETAGALQLRLPGAEAAPVAETRRVLSHEELSERIRARPFKPFSVWDGRVRLSIAGYQDKIAVFEEDGQWALVEGARLASTHILKPEPVAPQLAGLTGNEFFCMRLAHWSRLPVAEVALVRVPEPVLAVKRFDRELTAGRVVRRHIIDGCQALGLSSALKYERPYGDTRDVRDLREGASLPMLFALLEHCPRPAAERLALLRWVLFQVLIGNTDAHAKNVSFYMGREGLSLAPAYDLVCGLAFDGEKLFDTYAMAIGDAFHAQELSPFEWANLAHACALPFRQVGAELSRMAQRVRTSLPKACEDARAAGVAPVLIEQLCELVAAECVRQADMAPDVAKVDPELY
ncbi:MAG TPA: HipA domain-containing protein [Rhodocyclaceae bacterium]|nr:HipA domain-containing protein [Rhodocyclaceae bacterium]